VTPGIRIIASEAGMYLGACVWFETVFGDSVVGHPFVPKGMDPAYASFLQTTAHLAVERSRSRLPRQPGSRVVSANAKTEGGDDAGRGSQEL
jgi:hypothetical protein